MFQLIREIIIVDKIIDGATSNIELVKLVDVGVGEPSGVSAFLVGIVTGALLLGHVDDDGEPPNVRPNKSSKFRSDEVTLYVAPHPGKNMSIPRPQVIGNPFSDTTRG